MSECRWCAYLRSIGASEEYIAEEHAVAEYLGHVAPDDALAQEPNGE